jgi:hypothetical protein
MSQEIFNGISTGELAGSATAVQCPDVPCRGVYLKAVASNAGNVYIGTSTVTVINGTTDVTSGFELKASEILYLPINNLNILWRICDNAGDDLTYVAMG